MPVLFLMLALVLVPLQTFSQNPILNHYTMGHGFTFTDEDQDYTMNIRAYGQPYFESKSYSSDTTGTIYNRFRMRRLRLRMTGDALQHKIDYRFQIDLSGTSETGDETSDFLMDAWIAYNPTRRIQIKFGQSATPTDNRELTMGSQTLQLVERSRVTSAFSSIREFGLFVQGTSRTTHGSYIKSYFTLTNGDGLNVYSRDRGGVKVGGRIDFLPFGLFTTFGQFRQADVVRELQPKLVIGANYSINHGMSSRRGRASGSILYLNDSLEESFPTYTKYGIDMLFKYRGFSLLAEFVKTSATVPDDIAYRVRNDGSTARTFDVDGVRDVENYVKGRMMLGEGYNVQMGYYFKSRWSVDARYCHLEADKHSFLHNGTFYNRPNYYTLGVSKYFTKGYGWKIQASMTYVEVADGSNDIYSNPIEGHEWIGRLITSIAF